MKTPPLSRSNSMSDMEEDFTNNNLNSTQTNSSTQNSSSVTDKTQEVVKKRKRVNEIEDDEATNTKETSTTSSYKALKTSHDEVNPLVTYIFLLLVTMNVISSRGN